MTISHSKGSSHASMHLLGMETTALNWDASTPNVVGASAVRAKPAAVSAATASEVSGTSVYCSVLMRNQCRRRWNSRRKRHCAGAGRACALDSHEWTSYVWIYPCVYVGLL